MTVVTIIDPLIRQGHALQLHQCRTPERRHRPTTAGIDDRPGRGAGYHHPVTGQWARPSIRRTATQQKTAASGVGFDRLRPLGKLSPLNKRPTKTSPRHQRPSSRDRPSPRDNPGTFAQRRPGTFTQRRHRDFTQKRLWDLHP